CEALKTVTFEQGVTEISENLFAGCTGLEQITIPDTVTAIEYSAFEGCLRLNSVTIGDAVTTIGYSAFENCRGLANVTIPDSVTTIGEYLFRGCSALATAKLSANISEIRAYMFQNCGSLRTVNFGDNITAIRSYAFENCASLTEVPVSANLERVEQYAFRNSGLTHFEGADKLNYIGYQAFYNCEALTDVVISSRVKTIESNAFQECETLRNVQLADYSVTEIKDSTFADEPVLQSIVLPKGLQRINSNAFKNCTKLTEVAIPESVTFIADNAFSYPAKMTVYGKSGSYAEQYCQQKNIRFVDNYIITEGMILDESICDAEDYIIMETGEVKEMKFEVYPEDANDVITLTANNSNVSVAGMHLTSRYTGDTLMTASTSSGVECTFTVHNRRVNSITLPTLPQSLTVTQGNELDTTGMTVQVNYNDNTNKLTQDYTLSGFDKNTLGVQQITVTYKAISGSTYTTRFNIEVVDPRGHQTGIQIAHLPDKTKYIKRDRFDSTGLIVEAVFDTGFTEEITDYRISGYNALKLGKQTITVTSGDFTATFEVEVTEKPTYVIGDTDGNGSIAVSDVTNIQRYLADLMDFSPAQLAAADTNGDGKVDINDTTHLQKYLAEFDGIVLEKQN
ncbi:MAG: leucine-rich repeat protein, partial [Ruminococcus sp.]|nr:leucine-rich repeat protein [Ruminococcus sp.]